VSTRFLPGLVRAFLVALAAFVAVTWLALEGGEVVVLRTYDSDGRAYDSRVWIADDETGAVWIEAASDEKAFYRRVERHPDVELLRDGRWMSLRAVPERGEQGHRMIRERLARKYEWRDRWVGMLADVSRSVAVRLERR
jgi:hypothetical protein